MKKLLLMLGAVMAFSAAQAQYYYVPYSGGNPRGLNQEMEAQNSTSSNGWSTIFAGSAVTVNTPTWTAVQTLPFAFSLGGTPVTSYKVSNTGVLTFTTTATAVPAVNNVAIPSTDIPDNSILAWGIQATAGDFIITKTFGTAPNRQHWIQFNSFSQNGNSGQGVTYWSIVLEETTNEVHIVDQYSAEAVAGAYPVSMTAGIQLNSTTAVQVAGSPNLNSTLMNTSTQAAADNAYYTFTPGTQPAYDLTVNSVTNQLYPILGNAPFNITGVIRNLGSATVTSFTLNYKINGGATVSAPITTNISPLTTYQFSHPTTWTPAAAGTYTIEVWATDINGTNADGKPANDKGSKTVYVVQFTTQRTVLHEVFTSSTCPPCKPGNANLRNITVANPGKSIDIKYQQDFPGAGNDQYQSAQSINRRGYYEVNSIPRMEVDGGWDGNANSYSTPLLNSFRNKPAIVSISGTHTLVGRTLTAQAIIDPMGNAIPSTNLVAHMVITEKRTVRNIRTNGETEFFDVMKKMLPNENGAPVAALTGTPVTLTQTYTFPTPAPIIAPKGIFPDSVENFNNLDITIFLQDKVTKEVFQASRSVWTNAPTGVAEYTLASAVNLYPNPATNRDIKLDLNLQTAEDVQITVVNAIGQVVSQVNKGKLASGNNTLSLDLNGQKKGIYIVKVNIGDKVVTKTLSLTL